MLAQPFFCLPIGNSSIKCPYAQITGQTKNTVQIHIADYFALIIYAVNSTKLSSPKTEMR